MNKTIQLFVGIIVVAGIATATGFIVHRNDASNSMHTMAMSATMQKTAIKKAEANAAMMQKESDEMATHSAMMNSSSTPNASN